MQISVFFLVYLEITQNLYDNRKYITIKIPANNYTIILRRTPMPYETELTFFQNIIKNFHLSCYIISDSDEQIPLLDLGLRHLIYSEPDYGKLLSNTWFDASPNIVYRMSDQFLCNYIYFLLPGQPENRSILIGPYTHTELSKQTVFDCAERLTISPKLFPQLEKYYTDLPIIPDESILFAIINTFGERIWGSLDNFSIEYVDHFSPAVQEPLAPPPDYQEPEEAFLSMQILEDRYATENRLIQAISQGLVHKAEMIASQFTPNGIEQRLADPVRNVKNYSIILNTLLRKGAEAGSVHPLHIDSLSSSFAKRIELITSVNAGYSLQKEMIHKYCLLVKNYSLKGYSLLVRKVLTHIDTDLTADLSLKAQADLLNVNASYLSTLFKKETGSTLTEYVNRKRVDHAILLLNSTNMQIQNIAQYCGIPDVNYFTKIFKKYIGTTPKDYRESIFSIPQKYPSESAKG